MSMVVPIHSAKPATAAKPERVGVLLVNLGTPDTADARGVRVYLREFLSDARVIEKQGLLWKLILNGIILPVRPRKKARDYQKIWNTEKNESPLKTTTRALSEKLANATPGAQGEPGGKPKEVAEIEERGSRASMYGGILHLFFLLLMIDMIWKPGSLG